MKASPAQPRTVRPLAVLACATLIGVCVLAAPLSGTEGTPAQRDPQPLAVSFDFRHPGAAAPRDLIGLSFEVSSLPLIASYAHRGDFITLLRSLGPSVMRFGGISQDVSEWSERPSAGPLWPATTVTAQDLKGLAGLTRATGWRVLLGVNLARYTPRAVAREVAFAKRELGERLADVEIGNEPDAYGNHGVRSRSWSFGQYAQQVDAYRRAIAALAPTVALAGPDISGTGPGAVERWFQPEALQMRPALLTGHYYSLGCNEHPGPSIARLLSPATRAGMERSLGEYAAVSRATEIPLRIDETNSVSCGGTPGVSNTFASALWTVQEILVATTAGIDGLNWHGHLESCAGYTPMCARSEAQLLAGQLSVQPEWYALLFAKPLLGDVAVPAAMSAHPANLQVAGFRTPAGEAQVVILDTATAGGPLRIHVAGPAGALRASAVALRAPSISATSGITLGGRSIAPDGAWRGPRSLPLQVKRSGTAVTVAPGTATMITFAR